MSRNKQSRGKKKESWRAWVALSALIAGLFILQLSHLSKNPWADKHESVASTTVAAKATTTPQTSLSNPPPFGGALTNAGSTHNPASSLQQYRVAVLQSKYGKATIGDLIRTLVETPGGPNIQLIYQALALRKEEALPVIKERLRTGEIWEKHMLTKFLRICPWQEAKAELLALARNDTENWLPRQGALYALGSVGDASVGSEVILILNSPAASLNLQMAALSTLARIGFKEGAAAVRPFTQAENIHVRLFATRALAELGETIDQKFLLSALRNEDYVARQEASEALWKIEGQDVTDAIRAVAKSDFNEAVRDAASQALLRREIAGRNSPEKVEILRKSLDNAERLTALWILRTILDEAGTEGHAFVETISSRNDFLGERSRAYLVLSDSKSR
jgi:HEAT repeat protein